MRKLLYLLLLLPFLSWAGSMDLSYPSDWYYLGTVYYDNNSIGFLLGDSDGYTVGDSCYYKWTGYEYDYDYAISKYAFKAPFSFIFKAQIQPTSYGYHEFNLYCLPENATLEDFTSCTENPPFENMEGKFLGVGTRWEAEGICASVGDDMHEEECVSIDPYSFPEFEVVVDENYHARIYVNGELLNEGDITSCKSGYYLATFRCFDGQIDLLNATLEASEIKSVEDIVTGSEGAPGPSPTPSHEGCATFDFITMTLNVPCVYIGCHPYWLKMKLVETRPEIILSLEDSDYAFEEADKAGDNCGSFDFFTNTLEIPCLYINGKTYKLKLGLTRGETKFVVKSVE